MVTVNFKMVFSSQRECDLSGDLPQKDFQTGW